MSRLGYVYIFSIAILHASGVERRILSGKPYTIERNYVVYLLKATTETRYDAWICGGAIATPSYIVTSAACVEDVKHMYAIAGYSKYVTYEDLNKDPCTKEKKKKIVYVCVPSAYSFDYPKIEQWANIDIAVVKVETPYDFTDGSYKTSCSYIPSKIEINYDPKYEEVGTDAVVFGWGHTKKWRDVLDAKDYNVDNLLYGSVKLADKEECKKQYDKPEVQTIIEKYMVCSIEAGNINDRGDLIDERIDPSKLVKECGPGTIKIGRSCQPILNDFRRNDGNATHNITRNDGNATHNITRRSGICQNDHGGPLITWRGPKEIMIGLASVFRVEKGSNACIPPFLYTSTYCNSAFLHCLLNQDEEHFGPRRYNWEEECLKPAKERGFNIIRRTISWIGHPDGPALNEMQGVKIQKRMNDSLPVRNRQERKPDTKNVHKDEEKKPETNHPKVNLAPKIEGKKSDTKPVDNHGGNDGQDDEVIKFSDLLQPQQET